MTALLEVEGLTKRFPGVLANDAVSFAVERGQIHALLGENGAGKSTLVKMIYGSMRPDAGVMRLEGRPHAPADPGAARRAGVGLVFQHFSLFDALTVAENVALGLPPEEAGADLAERIRKVSAAYGLPLDPERRVGELSVGARQRVEIVRCLLQRPRLLIMDEPTSVLTPQEVGQLFRTLRQLRDEGVSILYISHKLDEIRELCEAATILRHGRVTGRCDPRRESARSLAEMMIGQELAATRPLSAAPGEVRLTVRGLSLPADRPFGTALRDISFDLRAGEILGVAGVAGNGQDEFVEALSGERRAQHEAIRLDGAPIGAFGPDRRRRLGLCVAPEERLGHAAVPDMSLTENAILTARRRARLASRGGVLRLGAAARFARAVVERFDVRTAGVEHAARSLSGGNLQKFVVGREIMQNPAVLVVAQPTWGVDAGAAAAIRQALRDMAEAGAAVLAVSQDLDELMEISTRFAVMAGGRLSAPRPMAELSVEEIGRMMGGTGGEVAHAEA
ncbi:ABC transporter ATP-binding protein [Oceanicella actignis]|uniref:Simple sugar transport system ATP-binding protein n=1 Tax=Oceanicella actignis TaxID=1189325 RepID=A0A1M7RSD1_9RHOB|nr:ABC transporter ATP-binding protein [Oceanicella actignis]SET05937.1 nucleoside ABC transporter ATP-binding protein [Oceanicella actignis]SHN49124.1 simple sugar transport system ATP-binding protein [Oceanicella actignis]